MTRPDPKGRLRRAALHLNRYALRQVCRRLPETQRPLREREWGAEVEAIYLSGQPVCRQLWAGIDFALWNCRTAAQARARARRSAAGTACTKALRRHRVSRWMSNVVSLISAVAVVTAWIWEPAATYVMIVLLSILIVAGLIRAPWPRRTAWAVQRAWEEE